MSQTSNAQPASVRHAAALSARQRTPCRPSTLNEVFQSLLVINGELAPNCQLEGAKLAIEEATRAYCKAGAADRLMVLIAPGVKHQVTPQHR
jgi:hypothetical protein